MSCSLIKTQTEKVLSDEEFLKNLETRIGIRFLIFTTKYNKLDCKVFLFGYTDRERTGFFWIESSIAVVGTGRIEVEIWKSNITEKLKEKFFSWETRHETMPKGNGLTWWNKLVTPQLFTCVSVYASNVAYEEVSFVDATDPRLQIFYGLLAAHIKSHAVNLQRASDRYWSLKDEAKLAEMISRRLNGFVSENYFYGFGIPDEI